MIWESGDRNSDPRGTCDAPDFSALRGFAQGPPGDVTSSGFPFKGKDENVVSTFGSRHIICTLETARSVFAKSNRAPLFLQSGLRPLFFCLVFLSFVHGFSGLGQWWRQGMLPVCTLPTGHENLDQSARVQCQCAQWKTL